MFKWILFPLSSALLILMTATSGCGQKSASESTYLLPWSDAQGNYRLQEVTISTLTSGSQVRGQAAEIYFQPTFTDAGFGGRPAEAHLTHSGHVYVPMDVESSLALTVYAQFERIYAFEKQLGTVQQLSWPRKVGVELSLEATDGASEAHNNAHYFNALDVIGILPYSLPGVPFALNHGIVAHEHFHAHFQSQVLGPLQAMVASPVKDKGGDIHLLNDVVLRGWNEGLADLFATIYTGTPDFFLSSLPQVQKERALDGELQPIWGGPKLFTYARNVGFEPGSLVGQAYLQGTAVGRLLYRASLHSGLSQQAFLAHVMGQLAKLTTVVAAQYDAKVMDFEMIVPEMLRGLPLNAETCGDLKQTVSKIMWTTEFSQCSSL